MDAAHALGALQTCIVYGFGGEAVLRAMAGDKLTFVLQAEQHGTGLAVRQAVLRHCLSGDGPPARAVNLGVYPRHTPLLNHP